MKLFKNFKTKRQLRKEIEELKRTHVPFTVLHPLSTETRRFEKYMVTIELENDMPLDIAHTVLVQHLAEKIKEHMEVELTEEYSLNGIVRGLRGSIYLMRKDEKDEKYE